VIKKEDPSVLTPHERKQWQRLRRRQRTRRRILRSTAILPSLFTVGNGLAGFAAIHFAAKEGLGVANDASLHNLAIAAWLIFAAMVFDMLDGRVARLTRTTTDFGGQLDSLCDVISFGAAPAFLMVRTVAMGLREHPFDLPDGAGLERLVWSIAGLYLVCGTLRLARFNVENVPDESAHMSFRGLPIPGAAAPIAALVLLVTHLAEAQSGWRSAQWLEGAICMILPVVMLAAALLMVSRFRYSHVVNQYIRGRKPLSYLIKFVVVALAAMLEPYVTAAAVTVGYALSGLVGAIWRWVRHKEAVPPPPKVLP
jgi:CDP-diacylglycerol--serine O-phosphatidyltransferase